MEPTGTTPDFPENDGDSCSSDGKAASESSTSTSTSTLCQPSQRIDSTTESLLFRQARDISDGFRSRDLDHPALALYVAPEFRAQHHRTAETMSKEGYQAFIRHLGPNYYQGAQLNISSEWVDFDKTGKEPWARVWQFIDVDRPAAGVGGNALRVSKWRLGSDGNWLCYSYAVWRIEPLMFRQPFLSF